MIETIETQAGEERLRKFGDVIFSYFLPTEMLDEYRMPCNVLIMIMSGEMTIEHRGRKTVVHKGKYIFIRRDHQVQIHKYAVDGEPYSAISIRLERPFLKDYWNRHKSRISFQVKLRTRSVVTKMNDNPFLSALFASLLPFAGSDIEPTDEFIRLKLEETVIVLLEMSHDIMPVLFDFYDPWKIDILSFMEKNYQEEMSIYEYATYTGRSLATFKRDFTRETGTTPERWLTERRLREAYRLLSEMHEKPTQVFLKVGFKNRSHFTKAFKNQYGVSPSQIG